MLNLETCDQELEVPQTVDVVVWWSVEVNHYKLLRCVIAVVVLVHLVDHCAHDPWCPQLLQRWLDVHVEASHHSQHTFSS